jgi:hypothetical protein
VLVSKNQQSQISRCLYSGQGITAKPQFQSQSKAVLAVPLGVLECPNGARLVIRSPELLALLPSLLVK